MTGLRTAALVEPCSSALRWTVRGPGVTAKARPARLTHQLLAFARREVIQPKVVDLNDEVRHLEELLRRTIKEDIQLVLSLDDELRAILADPGQLEQVLVHVPIPARDAMAEGGTLTVQTRNFDVDDVYASSRPLMRPGPRPAPECRNRVHVRLRRTGSGGHGYLDPDAALVEKPFTQATLLGKLSEVLPR